MRFLSFLFVAVCVFTQSPVISAVEFEKPNIVFIIADDLGWADVNYNGATFYETPNFDAVANEGMRFNRAYSGGPNCAPTRACLISGMYSPRHQIWTPGGKSKGDFRNMKLLVPNRRNAKGDGLFPSKAALDASVVSIAEIVKQAGYKTAMLGKWHVGPDRQGFDVFTSNGEEGVTKAQYGNIDVAEKLTNRAVKFIEENRSKPFLLYLSHFDVHTPIRARKDVVQRYDEKLRTGDWNYQWNTTYAAMIEAFDKSIGRVRQALANHDLSDNTLVIVTSDNGGFGGVITGPLKGAKGSLCEGGVRVPTSMVWPRVIKPGSVCDIPITSVDFLPTFAELTEARLPQNQPVDGSSIVSLLRGKRALTERSIFWHFPLYLVASGRPVIPIFGSDQLYWRATPSSMICKGDWKLTYYHEDQSHSLYNIAEDPFEKNDRSDEAVNKATALRKELLTWIDNTNAPVPAKLNPRFSPSR